MTREDFESSMEALSLFSTLRAHLMMADSFFRDSIMEATEDKELDVGFVATPRGMAQVVTHNQAVELLMISILLPAVDTYLAMVEVRPMLKDPDLEAFLDDLGDRNRFCHGMKKVRNGVLHINSVKYWQQEDISLVGRECDKKGGPWAVMSRMRDMLHGFAAKCFARELKIWPLSVYKHQIQVEKRVKGEATRFA